jgi:hypothetical protein
VIVESEKEKYDCAIGTTVLLTLLFAYDGVIMGMPHLNFWLYLVLPHVVLAAGTLAIVWRRGIFNDFPMGYVIGFTAFLALAMMHQQTFLHNKNDWRGMVSAVRQLMNRNANTTVRNECSTSQYLEDPHNRCRHQRNQNRSMDSLHRRNARLLANPRQLHQPNSTLTILYLYRDMYYM